MAGNIEEDTVDIIHALHFDSEVCAIAKADKEDNQQLLATKHSREFTKREITLLKKRKYMTNAERQRIYQWQKEHNVVTKIKKNSQVEPTSRQDADEQSSCKDKDEPIINEDKLTNSRVEDEPTSCEDKDEPVYNKDADELPNSRVEDKVDPTCTEHEPTTIKHPIGNIPRKRKPLILNKNRNAKKKQNGDNVHKTTVQSTTMPNLNLMLDSPTNIPVDEAQIKTKKNTSSRKQSLPPTTQEDDDTCMIVNESLLEEKRSEKVKKPSNRPPPKSATQRSREFRERREKKKEMANQRYELNKLMKSAMKDRLPINDAIWVIKVDNNEKE